MKTLVIGGSGFLGSYIVDELLASGHNVTVLSRNPSTAQQALPDGVTFITADLAQLSTRKLSTLLRPFDGLVFAAGADERTRPDANARDFYFRENVDVCRRVMRGARGAGVRNVVVLNSMFTSLDKLYPELALTEHHPYIASRVAQRDMVLEQARGHFTATVLEVPWVFGDSRGKPSQWAALVHYARFATPLIAPRGGTIAISARNIGRAALGALQRRGRSVSLPVGDCHITWDEMLLQLTDLLERPATPLARLPEGAFVGMTRMGALGLRLIGEKSGLDFARLDDLLLRECDIDIAASQHLLKYGDSDVREALLGTIASVPEYRWVTRYREWADGSVERMRPLLRLAVRPATDSAGIR